jgi:hypothetical protein
MCLPPLLQISGLDGTHQIGIIRNPQESLQEPLEANITFNPRLPLRSSLQLLYGAILFWFTHDDGIT